MGEWPEYKLADLGKIVTGKTPPTSNPVFFGGSIPFVTPTDMGGRRIIDCTLRNLTELGALKVKSSYIKKPAIVVSCIGSDMGKAALVDQPFVSNQQINSIVVKEGFDRLFVYYNLSARKAEIRDKASGAAQPIMKKSAFGELGLRVPTFDSQQTIAAVLSALDDKIELNRRMNATLEGLARALFADWFVDFGPTRAKMALSANGAKNTQTSTDPYLAPEIWSLFPDRLDENGVPEGWGFSSVASLTHRVTKGTTPTKQQTSDALDGPSIKFLRVNNISNDGQLLHGNIVQVAKSVHEGILKRSMLQANDLLYTIAGTIGRVTKVSSNLIPANVNQAIAVVRPNAALVPPDYLLLWLSDKGFQDSLHSKIVQAVQANLSLGMLSKAQLITPPTSVLSALFGPIEVLLEKMAHNAEVSRTLAQTRDLLLPRLMSGELRVREAEKLVEDCA